MATAEVSEYRVVAVSTIEVEKGFNNRRNLGDLAELAASIKSLGLLEPLIVWQPNGNGRLRLIAGERRLGAAKLAGLKEIPVVVKALDDKARLEALLVENLHRKDIDPLEEADGYRRLLELGLKQKEIAAKVGRSEGHVSKRLALLDLPAEATKLVLDGKLGIADALELTPYVKDAEIIQETLKQVNESIRNGWGFRVSDHARGAARRVEEKRKREAAIERLTAAKVSIIKHDTEYGSPRGVTVLGNGYDELPISASEHAKGPCHAAFVRSNGEVLYVCTKLANHKASTDKAVTKAVANIQRYDGGNWTSRDTQAGKEQAKKAAASRERNKVLRVREPIRIAELKRLLTAKQKREDVLDLTLRNLLQLLVNSDYEVAERAAAYLDIPMGTKSHTYDRANPEFAAYLAGGSDRLFKLAYAFALASGEEPFGKLAKQGYFDQEYSTNAARYLDHLAANGYKPDKVELAQLPKSENGYRWRDAFDVVKPVKAKKKK